MEFKTKTKVAGIKPEKVVEVLTSEDYLLAHAEHYRSLEAKVEYAKKSKTAIDLIVHKKEYGRNMKGGVDKSTTENAAEHQNWDLKKCSCTWKQTRDSFGKMVSVEGSTSVVADGDGSVIINEGDIDIRIPMIGKKLASSMVKKLENDGGKYEKFLGGYLKK